MITYVLDTSVLLSLGKKAFSLYPGQGVVVPLVVISELEKKRNDPELGLTARSALRFIEELRNHGNIRTGVKIKNGSIVRVEINHIENSALPASLVKESNNDVKILAVAKALGAVLVTQDLPMRIKAEVLNVETGTIPTYVKDDDDKNVPVIALNDDEIARFYSENVFKTTEDLPLNTGVILQRLNGENAGIGIIDRQWEITRVHDQHPMSINPRNVQQTFSLHHLMNKDVGIVSLGGKSGSGKSMLALAAGLTQVKEGIYKKVIVFKPAYDVMGGNLGYLPGTLEEKFAGFTASVYDAAEAFATSKEIDAYIRNGQLEILPVSHLRGRTLNSSFVIFDEAQNAEFSTLLTVLTRVGKNSKIVLTWDVSQRDNLHVGKHQGIYEVVSRFSGNKLFAHVEMLKSERSDVAEMAAELLADFI